MKDKLQQIKAAALAELAVADADIEQIRVRYLGKKGELTAVLRGMGALTPEERPIVGQMANEIRADIEAKIEARRESAAAEALEKKLAGEKIDVTIPGTKTPGMGGAMDLLVGARKVILTMEHTAKGNHKILKKCNLPLTAAGQVNMIITEMGVMDITPEGIVLREIHPEFTVEQVQEATGATLIISPELKPMKQ